jgi:hypothetical protein
MQLKDQVCSFELAKRLKELGVRQESLFYWSIDKESQKEELIVWNLKNKFCANQSNLYDTCIKFPEYYDLFSAFTVSELGAMLPYWTESVKRLKDDWVCIFRNKHNDTNDHSFAETEANARAKMLIYLINNKLI